MFEKQYKEEMEKIAPSEDLINRTKTAMKAEMQSKKNQPIIKPLSKRPAFRRALALATVAAIILLAVFTTNTTMPNGNGGNLFMLRVYGAERQPDGTYAWREMDITHLDGWAGHYDGEALYIGLGLWFEFEGYGISTVEFSLENGFFATQYIGNRGQVEGVPRSHVGIPPDFTTSRLVMYGLEFDKVGETIQFGNTMDDDILLFWASYDMSINDWYGSNMVIEIDVTATFEDGEIHRQQLVLDFGGGFGMVSADYGTVEMIDTLDWLTVEQTEYILSTPVENFTYVPDAVQEVWDMDIYEPNLRIFEFYIGGHTPMSLRFLPFSYEETGTQRYIMGARDGLGYVVIVEFEDTIVLSARAYSILLN